MHVLVNKEGDAHDAEEEHEHGSSHEELIDLIHASILLSLILDLRHFVIIFFCESDLAFFAIQANCSASDSAWDARQGASCQSIAAAMLRISLIDDTRRVPLGARCCRLLPS